MASFQQSQPARRASAERTRRRLIEAGLRMAEVTGLNDMSVNAVVQYAGVSKGTFFHHFSDRGAYLVSLHRHFHDAMFEQVRSVATTLPAGPDRLNRMATVYLDYCLENHGVRALILEARGSLAIQDEVRARSKLSAAFVATDFAAMGWPEPQRAADLWVAAAGECALIELEAGGPDLATRRTLQYAFTLPRQE